MPLHYQQSADDYRRCVETQSQGLVSTSSAPLTMLSFDEQLVIQRTCKINGPVNSVDYRACANQQVVALRGAVTPDMSLISSDEHYALRVSCKNESDKGVLRYRQCVNQQVAAVNALPVPDLSATSLEERTALQIRCSALTTGPANFRSCMLKEGEITTANIPLAISNGDSGQRDISDNLATIIAATQSVEKTAAFDDISLSAKSPDTSVTGGLAERAAVQTQAISPAPAIAKTGLETEAPTLKIESASALPEIQVATKKVNNLTIQSIDADEEKSIIAAAQVLAKSAEQSRPKEETSQSMAIKVGDSPDSASVKGDQVAINNVRSNEANTPETDVGIPVLGAANDADVTDNTENSDPENEDLADKPPLDVVKDTAQELWSQLQSSLSGLTGIHKIIVMAALALPLVLIVFWLLVRGSSRKDAEIKESVASSHLADMVRADQNSFDDTVEGPGERTAAHHRKFTDQMDEFFADDDNDIAIAKNSDRFNATGDQTDNTFDSTGDHDDSLDASTDFSLNASSKFPDELSPTTRFDDRHEPQTAKQEIASIHDFSAATQRASSTWLDNYSREDQFSLSVEFLIYWMAYTDERYEKEMKQQLFALVDPDDSDLVKKRVLNQDTQAFADTVSGLQKNTSADQREQILKLLMALLVNEEAVTPVQNTMLRFLANAFGLSHETLDELFHIAFGHELPPMPRPDKPGWWDNQHSDIYKRWDARSVAQQSPAIQSRVKLGLPLTGKLNPDELEEKYQRAINRCELAHFDSLTAREQQLVEGQQRKFEDALDVLKEISA